MYGLYIIDEILIRSDRRVTDFDGMPAVQGDWQAVVPHNQLLHAQLNYDHEQMAAKVAQNVARFNEQQTQVYNAVMDSVNNGHAKLFFVHSAGGCGKTFVCNTIAAAVHAQGKVALCVASSGIAALLLDGGRTAHSTFKINIRLDEASTCSIRKNSDLHCLLQQTALLIWDEAIMQHKYTFDSVRCTLKDLLNADLPFGGITVLFGGDFCQTLPIIPKGSRQQIVSASIKNSSFWNQIHVHYLTQNMRLEHQRALSLQLGCWMWVCQEPNPDGPESEVGGRVIEH